MVIPDDTQHETSGPVSTIDLKLPGQAYQIHIQPGGLRSLGRWVRQVAPHGRAVLLSDTLGQATSSGWGAWPLIGALTILAGGWVFLRRTLRAKPSSLQLRRRELNRTFQMDSDEPEAASIELSQDPSEALGMLQRLHEKDEST